MPVSLHFAHVTDPHVSERGDSWGTLGATAPHLLRECFARLNEIDDLDFVLITGDVLDLATPAELDLFLDALAVLKKPWHFVPGNHDGFYDKDHPEALRPAEAVAAIDPRVATPLPEANQAYWSRAVAPGVQLIGLDSRIANDWSGTLSAAQLDWLRGELAAHVGELILVAIHHPIHKLGPHNEREWFDKFILNNCAVSERLLDQYPEVKMVISGHHHANQIVLRSGRMHLSTAALSGYPCVYRTIRLDETPEGWHAVVNTHTVADDETLDNARLLMLESRVAHEFEPYDPAVWVAFCVGRPIDQHFDGLLVGDTR